MVSPIYGDVGVPEGARIHHDFHVGSQRLSGH
jgi:hypothetical protein